MDFENLFGDFDLSRPSDSQYKPPFDDETVTPHPLDALIVSPLLGHPKAPGFPSPVSASVSTSIPTPTPVSDPAPAPAPAVETATYHHGESSAQQAFADAIDQASSLLKRVRDDCATDGAITKRRACDGESLSPYPPEVDAQVQESSQNSALDEGKDTADIAANPERSEIVQYLAEPLPAEHLSAVNGAGSPAVVQEERRSTQGKRVVGDPRYKAYELLESPVFEGYIPSQDPKSSPLVRAIFDKLRKTVNEPAPEGPVVGAGARDSRHGLFEYKIVEMRDPVACRQCPKQFRNVTLLKMHIRKEHPIGLEVEAGNKILCNQCGDTFKCDANLRRHIGLVHVGEQGLKCNLCTATFGKWHAYINHKKTAHGVIPPTRRPQIDVEEPADGVYDSDWEREPLHIYKCCTCTQVIANKGNMMRHIDLKHLAIKPFKCQDCDLTYGTEHNLLCHRLSAHVGASSSGN